MLELGRHFKSTNDDYAFRLRNHQHREQERIRSVKQLEALEDAGGDMAAIAQVAIEATTEQLEEFSIRLDQFDTRLDLHDEAIIKALQRNNHMQELIRQRLAIVETELQSMLDNPITLEDGRRVFMSENRQQVFDEFGNELGREDVDFDMFPEDGVTSENYFSMQTEWQDLNSQQEQLDIEKQEILEFQEQNDQAREQSSNIQSRLNEDGMTRQEFDDLSKELDSLEAELDSALPPAVKAELPEYQSENLPQIRNGFANSAQPLAIANGSQLAKDTLQPLVN